MYGYLVVLGAGPKSGFASSDIQFATSSGLPTVAESPTSGIFRYFLPRQKFSQVRLEAELPLTCGQIVNFVQNNSLYSS